MKISVTEEDIRTGVRRSCTTCPIANATRRVCGDKIVWANTYTITIGLTEGKVFKTPGKAKEFILDFDNGNPVEPFEFELED